MKVLGSVAAVVAAIREDAAVEVDAIARQADADIARLRAEDARRPLAFEEGQMQIARARDSARARLAQEDWLDSRAAIDERETWLARVVELGQQRLARDGDESRKQRLARLVHECLVRLQSSTVDIVVSETDVPLLDEAWQLELRRAYRLETLTIITGRIDGGCLVRTIDGRASYDNTFQARADRFRTAWRAALAELYDRSVESLAPANDDANGR
jgi:vacuolar-type H+-ATPase subunit E/Vma4